MGYSRAYGVGYCSNTFCVCCVIRGDLVFNLCCTVMLPLAPLSGGYEGVCEGGCVSEGLSVC